MGGKDSIIVCADADLDVAVDGVVASAFGFSGQKCSACSRAIIENDVYDLFVERIRGRVKVLKVGDPVANPNMGPVINKAALDSMLGYIEYPGQGGVKPDLRRQGNFDAGRRILPGAHHFC